MRFAQTQNMHQIDLIFIFIDNMSERFNFNLLTKICYLNCRTYVSY